jgi:Zn-dependent protease with chaperone function
MNIGGLVDAPDMLNYLRNILARVVGVYPYDKPAIELYIDASDRGTAQATPDAEIYVSLGFLEKVETEGQIAMVLAHEAAHILLNHFSRVDYLNAQATTVNAISGTLLLAKTANNISLGRDARGQLALQNDEEKVAEEAENLEATTWLINRASDHLLSNFWSREQEKDADLLAADLLVRAGYNPRASADLFRLLTELRAEEQTYLNYLDKQREISSRQLQDAESPTEFASAALGAVSNAFNGIAHKAWQGVNKTHIDPAERQETMNTYRKAIYQSVKFSKEARAAERSNYQSAKDLRLPNDLLAGHRAANDATTALIEHRLKDAEKLAQKGISGRTSGSAHTRTVMANVRHAQKDYDNALLNLQRIAPGELRSRQSYELEMMLHTLKGRPEEALAVTERVERAYGTSEPFWPMRLQIHLERGSTDLAWEEHQHCVEEALAKPIRKECDAVMSQVPAPGSGSGKSGASPSPGLVDSLKTLF